MNKVMLMGRLTRDPEVRYTQGAEPMAVARYTLAVDRRFKKEEASADFISCVAFGKTGEFAEKYLRKGTKILIAGRIQTGSYTNKDGQKVYTTDIVVEEHEFAESKNSASSGTSSYETGSQGDFDNDMHKMHDAPPEDFMNIPEEVEENLPFDN